MELSLERVRMLFVRVWQNSMATKFHSWSFSSETQNLFTNYHKINKYFILDSVFQS